MKNRWDSKACLSSAKWKLTSNLKHALSSLSLCVCSLLIANTLAYAQPGYVMYRRPHGHNFPSSSLGKYTQVANLFRMNSYTLEKHLSHAHTAPWMLHLDWFSTCVMCENAHFPSLRFNVILLIHKIRNRFFDIRLFLWSLNQAGSSEANAEVI